MGKLIIQADGRRLAARGSLSSPAAVFLPAAAVIAGGQWIALERRPVARKSLVVLQFVVSITLLLGTVFIHPADELRDEQTCVNTENVLTIPARKLGDKVKDFKETCRPRRM